MSYFTQKNFSIALSVCGRSGVKVNGYNQVYLELEISKLLYTFNCIIITQYLLCTCI